MNARAPVRSFARTLSVFAALVLGACASRQPPPAEGLGLKARDFVPLAVGNRWVYRVTPEPADGADQEVRILSMDAQGFYVDNHGGRLAPRTDGVYDGARYLIEEPIEEGHTWVAVPGPDVVERYKTTSAGKVVTVPAGTFAGTVEVTAEQPIQNPQDGGRATLRMTWSYAPHVGLVKMVQTVVPASGPSVVSASMELVRYALTDAPSTP